MICALCDLKGCHMVPLTIVTKGYTVDSFTFLCEKHFLEYAGNIPMSTKIDMREKKEKTKKKGLRWYLSKL